MKFFHKRKTDAQPTDAAAPDTDTVVAETTEKPYPFWKGLLAAFGLFLAYYVFQYAIIAVTSSFTAGWDEVFLQIALRIPVGLPLYFILRKKHFRAPKQKVKFFPMLLFLAMNLILYISLQTVWYGFGATAEPVSNLEGLMYLLNGFILAPFTEEIVFRGILFTLSRRKLDFVPSVIINVIIFATVHITNPKNMVFSMGTAMLACMLYEATGHIKYGMILHFMLNNSGLLVMLLELAFPSFLRIPVTLAAIAFYAACMLKRRQLTELLVKTQPVTATVIE